MKEYARAAQMSVSGVIKSAVREFMAAHPAAQCPLIQPAVHSGVHTLSDVLSSPPLLRPYRLPRARQSRGAAVGDERKGLLSDFW